MLQASNQRLQLVRLLLRFWWQVHLLHIARVVLPPMQELGFALLLKNRRFLCFAILLDHLLVCLCA